MTPETRQKWLDIELAEYERAQQVSPYKDEARVAAITEDVVSRGYKLLQLYRSSPYDEIHVANLLEVFDFPQGAHILDMACGIGAMTSIVHQQRPDLQFTMQNISEYQLSLCPEGFEKIHSDFHSIPVPDASFDGVMLCYALGYSRMSELVKEIARIVRPNGVVAIFDIFTNYYSPAVTERLGYVAYRDERLIEEMKLAGFELQYITDGYYLDPTLEEELGLGTLNNINPCALRFVK